MAKEKAATFISSDNFLHKTNIYFLSSFYTPGIYADGYIVFAFLFVCSYVRWFVRWFVR